MMLELLFRHVNPNLDDSPSTLLQSQAFFIANVKWPLETPQAIIINRAESFSLYQQDGKLFNKH